MRGAVVAVVRPNGGPAASHAVARRCGRLGLCSQDAGRVKDWVRVRDASAHLGPKSRTGVRTEDVKGPGAELMKSWEQRVDGRRRFSGVSPYPLSG